MTEPRGTDPVDLGDYITARRASPEDRSGDHFAAPVGSSSSGRLRFTNGAHRITIRTNAHMRSLCSAHFGDRMPTVGVQGGVVTIRYPRDPSGDWFNCRSERPTEVELNARVPWDVEISGGASRLIADLRELWLGSLSLDGGASRLEVVRPAPSGTVIVGILGGASNIVIRRPTGVDARLRVDGGATNLKFDDRHIGAAGVQLDLQSRYYYGANDRYDIAVTGGANNLSLDTERGWKKGADFDREDQ